MKSGVNDDIVLAKLLRQDRALVVLGISAMTLLGWAYLFYQDWECDIWISCRCENSQQGFWYTVVPLHE
jgi:hypothetical protein